MKKFFTRVQRVFLKLFLLCKGREWALDSIFKARILTNTNCACHNITTNFDLNPFFKGVTIDKVIINPCITKKTLLSRGLLLCCFGGFGTKEYVLSLS